MVLELRGVPCLDLEEGRPDNKTIMASRSFGRPVEARHEMEEAVSSYTSRAAEKMRRQDLAAGSLMVFVNTNRHRPQDAQHYAQQGVQLAVASADTPRLVRAALRGLASIWRPGFRYKKAGVVFLDLVKAGAVQSDLFGSPDDPRSLALMRAVDQVNRRYGRETLTIGSSGRKKLWKLRSEQLSAAYTTRWGELLPV